MVEPDGQGHDAVVAFLEDYDVELVICRNIGEGAIRGLETAGISVCPNVEGLADDAVEAFMMGSLQITNAASLRLRSSRSRWTQLLRILHRMRGAGKLLPLKNSENLSQKTREIFFSRNCRTSLIAVEMEKLKVGGMDKTTMLCNGMNHPAPEHHRIFANCLYDVIFG